MFHKGFTTHALTKILTDSITQYQGKYLWIYGRKNKKIMSREYDDFFKFLADEGIKNGVDFRCLFPMPKSNAINKASSKDREKLFDYELMASLTRALSLKNQFGLPVEKVFRLYFNPRTESIIRSDNAVIYRTIICDADGYPLPYTNTGFEVLSAIYDKNSSNNKGFDAVQKFEKIWDSKTESIPLTEELFNKIYKKKV